MADDFHALTIAEVNRETDDAISIALIVPPALADKFRFKPGQHIPVRAKIDGEEVRRTYSICSAPGDAYLRIAIKRHDVGRFSRWAHATLRPGMTLDAMTPQGRFTLPPTAGATRQLLFIAAGAGITPIYAMIAHALEHEPHAGITLVYGNRTMDDAIFRAALEDLKDRHLGRLAVVHVLSREETESPLLTGRITPDKLADLLPGLVPITTVGHAFLCGPGQMIRDLRTKLFDLGLARERVHHEFFAPAGGAQQPAPVARQQQPQPKVADRSEVVAVLDGVRHRVAIEPGEAVLDAVLRAGIRAPYACKGGMCCTCRARIVEGEAHMRTNYSLETWEIEKGFTLTCQAVPKSARLVVDYDAM